jgi:hypothetical protein
VYIELVPNSNQVVKDIYEKISDRYYISAAMLNSQATGIRNKAFPKKNYALT